MSPDVVAAQAWQFAQQGLAALQLGQTHAAIACYQHSLALAPNNPDVLHAIGVLLMRQLKIDASLRLLERAVELTQGQVPAIKQNYGWALSLLMVPLPSSSSIERAELAIRLRMLRDCIERIVGSDGTSAAPLARLSADEIGLLRAALRGGLAAVLEPQQLKSMAQWLWADAARAPLDDDGIEFVGYARAEIGLGENLRSLIRAVASTSLAPQVSASATEVPRGVRCDDASIDGFIDGRGFATRIVCVNPDRLSLAIEQHTLCRYPQAYRVGFWFWELEQIPRYWVEQAQWFDEIWAATDFVADAIRRDVTERPVVKIRTPVAVPILERAYTRAEFGLRENCCLFMFSFAYASFATRKNPAATIRAFRVAFPLGTESVQLLIKSSQSEFYAAQRDALVALAAADSRIIFLDQHLTRAQFNGLQSTIDCYISLHRCEGLGLGLAECMAQGKPVIATAYSGNLEFMNHDNSMLVDYHLIPVREGEFPDYIGQVWAEPSVEHAASLMRSVYSRPQRAAEMGQVGARYIAEHFSPNATGLSILERYNSIRALRGKSPVNV